MPEATSIRSLLARDDFRRLLATRLLSQFGDGVFQAALAGTVLFNPQRAAEPMDVAAAFAVLLLPYSLVGPFAGVWLDRWSRRQVLLHANLVRALLVACVAALTLGSVQGIGFYVAGLAVFAVNRFLLAALSAALPHTVGEPALVSANALSTTSGAVVTAIGGGAGLGLLALAGQGDVGSATTVLAAVVPYLAAAGVAAGFPRSRLGPDAAARGGRLSAREVAVGMLAGARHAWARPPAVAALAVVGSHRLCYGALTLMTLLLYRNTFVEGLPGLGVVLASGAVGTLVAAAATPPAVRRIGTPRWVTGLLVTAGLVQLTIGPVFRPLTVVLGALAIGFVGQAVKICVDTTLQECVDDDHRGRVFSVYDTLFNVAFVASLLVGAAVLPPSGVSVPVVVGAGLVYLGTAAAYVLRQRAQPRPPTPSHHARSSASASSGSSGPRSRRSSLR